MGYAFSAGGRRNTNEFLSEFAAKMNVQPGEEFAVEPALVQKLFELAVEDGKWFLGLINANVSVTEQIGQKLGLYVSGLVASRTDTSGDKERIARAVHGIDPGEFRLYQTDADVALRYATIDQWKHLNKGAFSKMWQKVVRAAIANDRIRIGWHGTQVSPTTDPEANPNGEDVNIGWLQQLRNHAADQIEETPLTIGIGGAARNLDALVYEMRQDIEPQFREDPAMRVMMSSDVAAIGNAKFYEAGGDAPSEKRHLDGVRILDTYGGLRAMVAPFMPAGTVVITAPKNLSIYRQEGTYRRQLIDNPKKSQVEDFNSFNEGYVVEQYCAISAATNISAVE